MLHTGPLNLDLDYSFLRNRKGETLRHFSRRSENKQPYVIFTFQTRLCRNTPTFCVRVWFPSQSASGEGVSSAGAFCTSSGIIPSGLHRRLSLIAQLCVYKTQLLFCIFFSHSSSSFQPQIPADRSGVLYFYFFRPKHINDTNGESGAAVVALSAGCHSTHARQRLFNILSFRSAR